MSTDYYVYATSGNDSNSGLSTELRKQTIASVISGITAPIIEDIIINLVQGSTVETARTYSDSFDFSTLTFGAGDAKIVIQPESWDDGNYYNKTASPYTSGNDWDVVNDTLFLSISNSIGVGFGGRVELRGLKLTQTESGQATVLVDNGGALIAKYCQFDNAVALAYSGGRLTLENCSLSNTSWAAAAVNGSFLTFTGNNYIIDPTTIGILVTCNSTLRFEPWAQDSTCFITEIKTTAPRSKMYGRQFAAILARENSMVVVQKEALSPQESGLARLVIRHEDSMLLPDQVGNMLESRSMLINANQIEFVKKDENGEMVEWDPDNTIICMEGHDTTIIY